MRDEGKFLGGDELDGKPQMFVGAAANPFADPFDFRPYRLAKKANAGANFIQTQIIFNVPKFREYMRRVVDLGVHEKTFILAGVAPIKSLGAVNNEIQAGVAAAERIFQGGVCVVHGDRQAKVDKKNVRPVVYNAGIGLLCRTKVIADFKVRFSA